MNGSEKYYSKNSGAICYLISLGLLIDEDIEIVQNKDGLVVVAFVPTDDRMEALRRYIESFRYRSELIVDIVNYNSNFSKLKRTIDNYKVINGLK